VLKAVVLHEEGSAQPDVRAGLSPVHCSAGAAAASKKKRRGYTVCSSGYAATDTS
jgi:hypothetical protein